MTNNCHIGRKESARVQNAIILSMIYLDIKTIGKFLTTKMLIVCRHIALILFTNKNAGYPPVLCVRHKIIRSIITLILCLISLIVVVPDSSMGYERANRIQLMKAPMEKQGIFIFAYFWLLALSSGKMMKLSMNERYNGKKGES